MVRVHFADGSESEQDYFDYPQEYDYFSIDEPEQADDEE